MPRHWRAPGQCDALRRRKSCKPTRAVFSSSAKRIWTNCFFRQMPSGLAEFYNNTRSARKIIVVDLGFLGDSVHLVPALWEIERHYPQAELHALAAPVGGEVLALAPCVDKVWPLELAPGKRTWREQWRLVRGLRREHFDVAFNFGGSDRTIITAALTSAPWRVA